VSIRCLIEAHAMLQQRRVKVIASYVKTSNGSVSRRVSAVMVMKTVVADLMRKIAVSNEHNKLHNICRTQRVVLRRILNKAYNAVLSLLI
jgi:23S rRNA C2498 (ribose-2'-O)-methylase RlmM